MKALLLFLLYCLVLESGQVNSQAIDSNIPAPTDLVKVSSTYTSLTIKYTPPDGYVSDARYTHFIIRYKRTFDKKWKELQRLKTDDFNNVLIFPLNAGFLYNVEIYSQYLRRTRSQASSTVNARTLPPQVSNLKVLQSNVQQNWTDAMVSWQGPPPGMFARKYDRSVLSYYIKGLSVEDESIYPRRNVEVVYNFVGLSMNRAPRINQLVSGLIPGATYTFEVVSISDGEDMTESEIASVVKTIEIPAPRNLTKIISEPMSMTVTWENNTGVDDVTAYQVRWVDAKTSREIAEVETNDTYATARGVLTPGTLYQVEVQAIRNNSKFGRKTQTNSEFFRTKPAKARDLDVIHKQMGKMVLRFAAPLLGEYNKYFIRYFNKDGNTQSETKQLIKNSFNNTLTMTNLTAGSLYRIEVYIISGSNYIEETDEPNFILARTNPPPPANVQISATQGAVFLEWGIPSAIGAEIWRYEIEYYEKGKKSSSLKKDCVTSLGQQRHEEKFTRLQPGTGYEFTIVTVAGRSCSSANDVTNYETFSTQQGPLVVYTQPEIPRDVDAKQITLSRVRVRWRAPSSGLAFDFYRVTWVRQDRKRERHEVKLDKNLLSHVTEMEVGSNYRITVVTVAGDNEVDEMESDVIKGTNSIRFRTWHPYNDHFPFTSLTWKLDSCGKSGRFGPSQLLCDNNYRGSNLNGIVIVEDGIQYWTAPMAGLYQIVAAGGGYVGPGGKGAVVSTLFTLEEGTVLKIAVGQRGITRGVGMTMGGAGGTFVVEAERKSLATKTIIDADGTELMLAAGGAGTAQVGFEPSSVADANIYQSGSNASVTGRRFGYGGSVVSGVSGPGLRGQEGTAGGAGFHGHADNILLPDPNDVSIPASGYFPFYFDDSEDLELRPLVGGRYERKDLSSSEGGFGGGGAGYSSGAGGGGGYSGGGAGPLDGYSGGGGSYVRFSGAEQMAEVSNDGSGYVIIQFVGFHLINPLPLTPYLVVAFLVGILFVLFCCVLALCVVRCTDKCMGIKHSDVYQVSKYHDNNLDIARSNGNFKSLDVDDEEEEEESYLDYNDEFEDGEESELQGSDLKSATDDNSAVIYSNNKAINVGNHPQVSTTLQVVDVVDEESDEFDDDDDDFDTSTASSVSTMKDYEIASSMSSLSVVETEKQFDVKPPPLPPRDTVEEAEEHKKRFQERLNMFNKSS